MVAAFAAFALLDTTAKHLTQTYAAPFVIWGRYATALAIVLIVSPLGGGLAVFRTSNIWLHVLRGGFLMGATTFNFIAIQYLQLAQTSAIMFSNPLWVCALSPVLLGERVGIRRWSAVIIGFLGVLVIVRPGTVSFHWAMLLSICTALCSALYQIATRRAGSTDSAMTSLFYASLVGAVAASPFAPISWSSPGITDWMFIFFLGLAGSLGHWMLGQAHRLAPAPLLAPFVYTQIIWMIILGYVVFGDVPDGWTIAGSVIVVASGLYVYYRERYLSRQLMQKR